MCGCFERERDEVGLLVGREGEVDDLDLGVLDQRLRRVVDAGDAPALGHLGGAVAAPRGDRHHREAGVLVGGEVALGHDHAGADAADPEVPAADRRIRREAFGVRHRCPPMPVRPGWVPGRRVSGRGERGRHAAAPALPARRDALQDVSSRRAFGPLSRSDDQYSFTLSTRASFSFKPTQAFRRPPTGGDNIVDINGFIGMRRLSGDFPWHSTRHGAWITN